MRKQDSEDWRQEFQEERGIGIVNTSLVEPEARLLTPGS
jgi:hypothetical protein